MDAICAKNASGASEKLLTQLKTMDKDGVKDLINNPKQPYKKKVLNIQAREKLREQMRKRLKVLGMEGDSDFQLEPDECIDYEKIPETLIAQIGQTIDINLDMEDMDLSESLNEEASEDKDIEVVTKNLGSDFLMGSEMLLMNGFSLLAETDTEGDVKGFNEIIPEIPPLPVNRPPSPPPEPVAAPEIAVFCSKEKNWSPARPVYNDDWDIESAKNPDPPSATPVPDFDKPVPRPKPVVAPPAVPQVVVAKPPINRQEDDEWDNAQASGGQPDASSRATPVENGAEASEPTSEPGQRANETYGEYRRRMAAEREIFVWDDEAPSIVGTTSNSRPQNDFNKAQTSNSQWKGNDNKRNGRGGASWTSNNRQNDSNRQNRPSRLDTDRERDRKNSFQQRNSSRDTNRSLDSGRHEKFDDVKDGHNYRFQNEKNTQEPVIERLNTMLNPKPLQFKGSFNKRSQYASSYGHGSHRRSRSRQRTPQNNSMERDFGENLLPSPNDVRPCLTTLRKVMEIDAELAMVHEKVRGIDQVISNLRSERIAHQKTTSRLLNSRKVLFDHLMKRALSTEADKAEPHRKEKSQSTEPVVPPASHKSVVGKKLQNIVDQKKRKHEEQPEEPKKKKPAVESYVTTSAAEKAAQIQKEKEEEERRLKVREQKRLKNLRRENERARLEERIRQEATASTTITIKQEPPEKSSDKNKSHKNHQQPAKSHRSEKPKEQKKILFKLSDTIQVDGSKSKPLSVNLQRVPLAPNLIETFLASKSLEIDIDDWNKWCKSIKPEAKVKDEKPAKATAPDVQDDPLVLPVSNFDPLAMDESSMNPPTPGSTLMASEDSMLVEIQTEPDYAEWRGNFTAHEQPIVHLQNVNGKFLVAACEDGKVFKYHLSDGKLVAVFSKHTEICNSFLYDDRGSIYTVSSDGFLHKIKFKVRTRWKLNSAQH